MTDDVKLNRHLIAWASQSLTSLQHLEEVDAQHARLTAQQSELLAQAQRRQAAAALQRTISNQRLITAAVWLLMVLLALGRGGFVGFLMLLVFSFIGFVIMVNIPLGASGQSATRGG